MVLEFLMSVKFKVQQVGGSLATVDCPDPNSAEWEFMTPLAVSLTGRGVQQGRARVTLKWELMSDDGFGSLMDEWLDAQNHGYRFDAISVPTFAGHDNATYGTYSGVGQPGGYVRMLLPKGKRTILHVEDVEVTFEDILNIEGGP
jgi:hypothetical protein